MTVSQQEAQEPAEERPKVGDFFVLESHSSVWYLSVEMARAVDRDLAATPLPEWTVFVDLAGARVRLRTNRIESLAQCSAEQRTACREFTRRLRQERKADKNWEEDE